MLLISRTRRPLPVCREKMLARVFQESGERIRVAREDARVAGANPLPEKLKGSDVLFNGRDRLAFADALDNVALAGFV